MNIFPLLRNLNFVEVDTAKAHWNWRNLVNCVDADTPLTRGFWQANTVVLGKQKALSGALSHRGVATGFHRHVLKERVVHRRINRTAADS